MENTHLKNIVGESFEEMSIQEMTQVQGTGDVNVETTPTATISAFLLSVGGGYELSIHVAKTVKGKC
ncbi:lichenicidin A2 family type 2 lantibiotic (plasmid) [Macrococcoides canis]|uniref:lichenicidin A2 family type 2 lantibiotic n=1 Tax=Macrococcoides canis TaxID=1855823 RepID=UPI001F2316B1|nr:lichenicidin A2 family type 2 lantibiotic [Macrococcus canis]UJS29014.1 lichenicidin A2 family type 2 lantibiotic [Macrococcus canis]